MKLFGTLPVPSISFVSNAHSAEQAAEAEKSARDQSAMIAALDRSALLIELDLAGQVITANENFLHTFGYTLEELQGQHHRKLVDEKYAASDDYRQFWHQLRSGSFQTGTYQRVAKDGSSVLLQATYNPVLDESGKPTKILKIATDISRQLVEREKEARLLNMIESMPFNIMLADRDLVIRYVNPASLRTFKQIQHLLPIPLSEIVGSSIGIFHQDPQHQAKILADSANLPIKTQFKLGGETIDLHVSAIFNQEGEYVGPMSTWNIVTEQSRLRGKVDSLADVGQSVANNVAEMAQAIEEINDRICRTAQLAEATDQETKSAGVSIRQLSDSSQEIDGIVLAIQELAEQTNLLALNATIEAARAGEAGRSFAVVAAEVKSLATGTSEATTDISERVKRIRENIDSVVSANDRITSSVTEVNLNSNTVASAVEEQGVIVQQMKSTADHLVTLADELKKL
ncbi:methyl-accepting chemotaxis protein [Blastopirellula marina]|uniref:Histidine kinase n=1 Tax=Blastopirellula marina TaxID=124 RepID=A0A2S8GTT3_9BACT|nr:methyl-accepting chemotaxis protein [Blastopirellula marina]PQO47822.1 histidine kinase [Blastopirellula marina]